MNTENPKASTGSARPSSVQNDPIEITDDSQHDMLRHGWKLGGTTTDQTILGNIKFGYQEAGYAVAFTWGMERGSVIYWIHDGELAVSKSVSKGTRH